MKKIKFYNQFISEEVSGVELVGPVGPAFGETRLQNKTVNFHNTNVIFSDTDNRIYTIDEFNDIYHQYLSKGGKPLPDGFNSANLTKVQSYLNGN